MERALDQYARWGVKGVKVDFIQRDDQAVVKWLERASAETAKRHMLIDFHGVERSAMMTRTWPNLISNEGVRGLENAKWSTDPNPDQNVTLPYSRMFVGPMDYTPGAMLNATKKSFAPIKGRPMGQGTRCHQLAMYVVFESPLQMLADSPSNYLREPEAMDYLARVPTTWDETKPLAGELGQYIVIARRHGKEWYVGAMSNWSARDVEINLSFLPAGAYTLDAWRDGVNADRMAGDYVKQTSSVTARSKLKVHLAPGGGFAARIHLPAAGAAAAPAN
jgi:alpha-glucosidase